MEKTVRRATVRQGYAVLLIAEVVQDLPDEFPRLCDFTARQGDLMFRSALEREGERAKQAYSAPEDNRMRARWRVRRLRLEETAGEMDGVHLLVRCTLSLNGECLQMLEWIWNREEETVLPPAQCRSLRHKLANCAGHRQKINKFYAKNPFVPLAKKGKI